jgi:hypothetical protein
MGGLEPPTPCVSGRCSNQVSYIPAEGGGLDPKRLPAQPGSSRRLPEQLHLPRADDGGHEPQPFRTHPASNGRPHPGGFIIQSRMAQDSNLPAALAATSGFRPGTLPTRSAILKRRAEQSKPTPCGGASLSGRARHARPVHSPCVPSLGLEPRQHAVYTRWLCRWPRRAWSDRPDSNWRPRLGKPGC